MRTSLKGLESGRIGVAVKDQAGRDVREKASEPDTEDRRNADNEKGLKDNGDYESTPEKCRNGPRALSRL